MDRRLLTTAVSLILVLAACSPGGASQAPRAPELRPVRGPHPEAAPSAAGAVRDRRNLGQRRGPP